MWASRINLSAVYIGAVLALAVARFGSTPENLRYQLLLLLIPAGLIASFAGSGHAQLRVPPAGTQPRRGFWIAAGLIGLAILFHAAFQPTTEARGYVLAAIAWLSFFAALRFGTGRTLFFILILIGAGEAVYGLLQAVGGVDQIGNYSRNLGRVATGTFVHRNHFAGLLNMCLGLSLGALYTGFAERHQERRRRSETLAWSWLVVLSCSVVGLAVFLSRSRGGSLILIATLVFVFVLLKIRARRRERHALPSAIVLVLLVATLAVSFSIGIGGLLERFENPEVTRPVIYRDTLKMIADHPWAGVGPGMYGYRFRAYQTIGLDQQYSQTHNDYLQVAAEWGLPVALFFWGFVVWVFWRSVRLFLSRASPWRQGVGLGCAAAIFSLLVHSLVDFNLQIPANLAVFAAILGISLACEPTRNWEPTEVRSETSFLPPSISRALFLVVLPLALLIAAWRIAPRMIATQIASGTLNPAELQRAAEWDPQNPDYPYLLGRYHRDLSGLRNLETAQRHLQRAAELAPWGWRAQQELAQLYELLGDGEKAEVALLRATSLSPRDSTLQWRLANLYLRSGEHAKMYQPLQAALAGDRTLLQPGWGVLSKAGIELNRIGAVWPEDRDARLFLLQHLVRDRNRVTDPAFPAFLSSSWDRLRDSGAHLTPAEASFFHNHLLQTGRADEARRSWIEVAAENDLRDEAFESRKNLVWNGRFEIDLTGGALDWSIAPSAAFEARPAPSEGVLDTTALRLDFNGTVNLAFSGVRQQIAVRPGTQHEFSYRARSLDLTTDEGVFLEVWDPRQKRSLLASEKTAGTTPWSLALLNFETPPETTVVDVVVRRRHSGQIDSRFAGTFWLDSVSVSEIETGTPSQ